MLIQLSGRIWYNEGEQETDRPYLYYIRGDEKSAVIDAGNSERHVKNFYQALAVGDALRPAPARSWCSGSPKKRD